MLKIARMKFFLLVLLVLCLLVVPGVAKAAPMESLEGQSQRGLRLILNRDYAQARHLFPASARLSAPGDEAFPRRPGLPAGIAGEA